MKTTPVIHILYDEEDNHPLPLMDGKKWMEVHTWLLQLMLSQLMTKPPQFNRVEDLEKLTPEGSGKQCVLIYLSERLRGRHPGLLKEAENCRIATIFVLPIQVSASIVEQIPGSAAIYSFTKGDGSPYFDFFNKSTEADFWFKLADLAYHILGVLQETSPIPAVRSLAPVVFLAECDPELDATRNNLKRDLAHQGAEVLSINSKPGRRNHPNDDLMSIFGRCTVSVHLIDISAEGSRILQDELLEMAVAHADRVNAGNTGSEFSIYVWLQLPSTLNGEQKAYRDTLIRRFESASGLEFLAVNFEEFKAYLLGSVNFSGAGAGRGEQADYIRDHNFYIIYDRCDEPEAVQLVGAMRNSGASVSASIYNQDLMAVRHLHQESLRRMHTVVVIAIRANPNWLAMKMMEIIKAPGLDRQTPIHRRIVVHSNSWTAGFGQFSDQFEKIAWRPDLPGHLPSLLSE